MGGRAGAILWVSADFATLTGMNRRLAVKNMAIVTGGCFALPMWMEACRTSAGVPMLAAVAETIIPSGQTGVGALAMGVDVYLEKMIDDCYERPVQDNIKRQLAAMDAAAKTQYGLGFARCSQQQRQEILLKWQASPDKDARDFFQLIKSETIRGFNTSEVVMEVYQHYKVAPGHYYGCVDVADKA
jgi:hypothetical protein